MDPVKADSASATVPAVIGTNTGTPAAGGSAVGAEGHSDSELLGKKGTDSIPSVAVLTHSESVRNFILGNFNA